jgi:hypothetical protein
VGSQRRAKTWCSGDGPFPLNCGLEGNVALPAVPPYQHGIEQARYYTAQYHYAYAESQRKVSLAPNTCFGGWYEARETEVNQRVPDAYCQPNAEGSQEWEAVAEHENVPSIEALRLDITITTGVVMIHTFLLV